ncbi:fungal-specific transcription factor domain-containing protein [Fusarium flagelliforme]|uniref:fungal-specific transcription factor domain-containing protein n=1 Tax=Fusarium flagelliforme TaxID=2675880 RepID=UPI001E8D082B|nr:fungal-specific transcription factor domain-containing protein [Fusarium flagelliforme]KAH7196706.1 fungal-specific transcription factor domain-containing protein [Fusarium flagelliforme]
MAPEMKASIHRFRLRRSSPPPRGVDRARSASPSASADQQEAQARGRHQTATQQASAGRIAGARSTPPACDRCRSFKKKCSRTFPVCSLCAAAGQRCSYTSPIANAEAQIHQLRTRVQWLSQYIDQNILPPGSQDATTTLPELRGQGQAPIGQQHAEIRVEERDPGSVRTTSSHFSSYQGSTEGSVTRRRLIARHALPLDIAPSRFVDAFFRHVNRAYPFVDQMRIRRDLETLGDASPADQDPPMTLLYLVMAIGCTSLVRAGQIPSDTARQFDVVYPDIIQECLCSESIESVQILVLLGLYSLFDPTATSAYFIVGIAARQAMVIGLTRPDEQPRTVVETELRHRLYWSIFVLDRMMASSQGLPAALTDEHANVPLPGLTVEEFASSDRATYARNLQTSRHIIQLRQLEYRILEAVHLQRNTETSRLAPSDRGAILKSLRAEIEDWYSSGCLMSPMEADNLPIHSSITWLSAQYYHLLIFLYFPNHFNSSAAPPAVTRKEQLEFASKQLQANSALLQQRQLPLNRVSLGRLLPIGLVLMSGFMAGQGQASFVAHDDFTVLITLLEAFPRGWTTAQEAAQIMQQFVDVTTGQGVTTFFGTATGEAMKELARPCIISFTGLLHQFLGKATCFQSVTYAQETQDIEMAPVDSTTQQQSSTNMLWLNGAEPDTGVSEEAVLGYGWGSWDLDFL